jgi:hypothetical protein
MRASVAAGAGRRPEIVSRGEYRLLECTGRLRELGSGLVSRLSYHSLSYFG